MFTHFNDCSWVFESMHKNPFCTKFEFYIESLSPECNLNFNNIAKDKFSKNHHHRSDNNFKRHKTGLSLLNCLKTNKFILMDRNHFSWLLCSYPIAIKAISVFLCNDVESLSQGQNGWFFTKVFIWIVVSDIVFSNYRLQHLKRIWKWKSVRFKNQDRHSARLWEDDPLIIKQMKPDWGTYTWR